MPNDAFTQQALAADPRFQLRVRNALMKIAWQVLNEAPTVAGHTQRATYARQVLGTPDTYAKELAKSLTTRTNLLAFATTYDFTQGAVVTASADADIESQLSTDWNGLAGV